jgi:hypothetical protein
VPLLAGGWLYNSTCKDCDSVTSGYAHGREEAEAAACQELSCVPGPSRLTFHDLLTTAKAVSLADTYLPGSLMVDRPGGWVAPQQRRPPHEVAVDASVRTYAYAVAAVTGSGWVQVHHHTTTHRWFNTAVAELLAVYAGVQLLPPNLPAGEIMCDNQRVCQLVTELLDGTRKVTDQLPAWIADSERLCVSLIALLRKKNVTVTWRKRNSTPVLRLADQLAKCASRPLFHQARLVPLLDWVRSAPTAPGTHGTQVKRAYRTAAGGLLLD